LAHSDELSDLAKKYPEMANAPGAAEVMEQVGPVSRMLEQLLVGLVPIRARCLNLTMIEHEGQPYVVRASDAESLGLPKRAIDVVGVTDLDQYWKDVRRVLFARGSFKMLCRVARDGFTMIGLLLRAQRSYQSYARSSRDYLKLPGEPSTGCPGTAVRRNRVRHWRRH
jgi:hypothetical protein